MKSKLRPNRVSSLLQLNPENLNLQALAMHIHARQQRWWTSAAGRKVERNEGELIALMHSELSEGLEGLRKDLQDTHLPHRKMTEVEMADTIIRILDYCAAKGYDVLGALIEKMDYNDRRADHKHSNRAKRGGKKF